jgi:hypothetical protein
VSVLLGNGDGTFQAMRNFAVGTGASSVAAGDFNRDGRPDLAVTNSRGGSVSVLPGNGDGTFRAPRNFVAGTDPFFVAVQDLNGDGRLDLAVASQVSNDVNVLLGNGDGTFGAARSFAAGAYASCVAVADLNADDRPDLAVANLGDGVSVLLGNGDGTFQMARDLPARAPRSVEAGDVNGDGRLDLVAGSGGARVFLGNGDGTFRATHHSYATGGIPQSVALADFNGDTFPDAATANSLSNDVAILINDGAWPAAVAGASVFYNNSASDGNDPAANAADDGAVAADKRPLTPGGIPTAANVTAYSRGVNGLMVDVLDLPGGTAALLASDFTIRSTSPGRPQAWASGPAPSSVRVRRGAGQDGADRVTLIWGDGAAVRDAWLEVTIKANAATGLAAASTFIFGNLVADANGDRTVNVADLGALAANFNQTLRTPAEGDFSGDRIVNVTDLGMLSTNFNRSLGLPPAPGGAGAAAARSARALTPAPAAPARGGAFTRGAAPARPSARIPVGLFCAAPVAGPRAADELEELVSV